MAIAIAIAWLLLSSWSGIACMRVCRRNFILSSESCILVVSLQRVCQLHGHVGVLSSHQASLGSKSTFEAVDLVIVARLIVVASCFATQVPLLRVSIGHVVLPHRRLLHLGRRRHCHHQHQRRRAAPSHFCINGGMRFARICSMSDMQLAHAHSHTSLCTISLSIGDAVQSVK